MTDKEKKLDKLRKLLALATGNANKAEAMAAIDKLHARAAEYGLTLAEIEAHSVETEAFGERSAYSGETQYGFVDRFLWKTIARFTCCKVNVGRDEDGDLTIRYFGHDVDVELAFWLRGTIKAAMAFEWSIYRDFVMDGGSTAKAMLSFHMGMADELKARMDAADRAMPSTGTDLVSAKHALVEQKAQEAGFSDAQGRASRGVTVDGGAYGSGKQAGARVNIGRSVSGRASASRMIGK